MARKKKDEAEVVAVTPLPVTAGPGDPLYIVGFRAQNIERLELVEVTFDPENEHLIEITGPNGAGKSSFLDAIVMSLAGKGAVPAMPVRLGAEEGTTHLDLGRYTVDFTVTPDRVTTLKVLSADGMSPARPQEFLNNLIDGSGLTLDPFSMTTKGPDEVAEIMRQLAKIDFTEFDKQRKKLYDERTAANAAVKVQAALCASLVELTVPDEQTEHDVSAAVTALTEMQAQDFARTQVVRECDRLIKVETDHMQTVAKLEAELTAARRRLAAASQAVAEYKAKLEKVPVVDLVAQTAAVTTKDMENKAIRASNATRADALRRNAGRTAALQLLEEKKKTAADLDAQIKKIDTDKVTLLAEAKYPVEGLALKEVDGKLRTFYNDLPFEQQCTSEKIKTTLSIAAALSPRLRFIPIRRGNDLDVANLAVVARWARDNKYQVLMERVAVGETPVGIVIEAGRVAVDAR